jgi:peptidoglycan/xylan/chitin deacetylase (PgdA/CDA1 family)
MSKDDQSSQVSIPMESNGEVTSNFTKRRLLKVIALVSLLGCIIAIVVLFTGNETTTTMSPYSSRDRATFMLQSDASITETEQAISTLLDEFIGDASYTVTSETNPKRLFVTYDDSQTIQSVWEWLDTEFQQGSSEEDAVSHLIMSIAMWEYHALGLKHTSCSPSTSNQNVFCNTVVPIVGCPEGMMGPLCEECLPGRVWNEQGICQCPDGLQGELCDQPGVSPAPTLSPSPSPTLASGSGFNHCGREQVVALTFDDGPALDHDATNLVLDELRDLNLTATFYLAAHRVGLADPVNEAKCVVARRIANEGHEIQSHGWRHESAASLSLDELTEEIESGREWLESCLGPDLMALVAYNQFRPPFGDLVPAQTAHVNSLGYSVAMWNVDTFDWRDGSTNGVLQQIDEHFYPGGSALILMHDRSYTSGTLAAIVDYFASQNYYTYVPASSCYATCGGNRCKIGNTFAW